MALERGAGGGGGNLPNVTINIGQQSREKSWEQVWKNWFFPRQPSTAQPLTPEAHWGDVYRRRQGPYAAPGRIEQRVTPETPWGDIYGGIPQGPYTQEAVTPETGAMDAASWLSRMAPSEFATPETPWGDIYREEPTREQYRRLIEERISSLEPGVREDLERTGDKFRKLGYIEEPEDFMWLEVGDWVGQDLGLSSEQAHRLSQEVTPGLRERLPSQERERAEAWLPLIQKRWPGVETELLPEWAEVPTPVERARPLDITFPWEQEVERIRRATEAPITEAELAPEARAQAEAWREADAAQQAFMAGEGPPLTREQFEALEAGPPTAPTTRGAVRDIVRAAAGAKKGVETVFWPVPKEVKEPVAQLALGALNVVGQVAPATERGIGTLHLMGLKLVPPEMWDNPTYSTRHMTTEAREHYKNVSIAVQDLDLSTDEASQLATSYWTWVRNPDRLEKALQEVAEGEEPIGVAKKYNDPVAEFFGQLVVDPLNVAGVFTEPIAKVMRSTIQAGKKLPGISKAFNLTKRSIANVAWSDTVDIGRVLTEHLDEADDAAKAIDNFIADPVKASKNFRPRAQMQAESVASLLDDAGIKGTSVVGKTLDSEAVARKLGDAAYRAAQKAQGMPIGGDRSLYNGVQRFLMEHWLGPRPGWVVFNGIDNSTKLAIEGVNPFQRIGYVHDAVIERYGKSFIPVEITEGGLGKSVSGPGKLLHQRVFGRLADPLEWNFKLSGKLESGARLRLYINKSTGRIKSDLDDTIRMVDGVLGPSVDDVTRANIAQDLRSLQWPNADTVAETFNRYIKPEAPAVTLGSFADDAGFVPQEMRDYLGPLFREAKTEDEIVEAVAKADADLLDEAVEWGKTVGGPHDPVPANRYAEWGGVDALFEEDGYRLMPLRPDADYLVTGALAHKVDIHPKHVENVWAKIGRELGLEAPKGGWTWAKLNKASDGEGTRLYYNYLVELADRREVELPSWFTRVDLAEVKKQARAAVTGGAAPPRYPYPTIPLEEDLGAGVGPLVGDMAPEQVARLEPELGIGGVVSEPIPRVAEEAAPTVARAAEEVAEEAPRLTAQEELERVLDPGSQYFWTEKEWWAQKGRPPADIGEAAEWLGVDPMTAGYDDWDRVRRQVHNEASRHFMQSSPETIESVVDKKARMQTEEGWLFGEWQKMRRGVTGAKGRAEIKRGLKPDDMTWPQFYRSEEEAYEAYMSLADELEEILAGGPPPQAGPLAVIETTEEGLPIYRRRPEVWEVDVTDLPARKAPPPVPEEGMPLLPAGEEVAVAPGELAGMPRLEVAAPGISKMEAPREAARGEALLGAGAEEMRRAQVEEMGRRAQMGMFGEIEEVTTPAMIRKQMADLREEVSVLEAQVAKGEKRGTLAPRSREFLQRHIDLKESKISELAKRLATEETGAFRPGDVVAPISDELHKWRDYVIENFARRDEVVEQSPEALRALRKARDEAVKMTEASIGQAQIYGLEETNRVLGDYQRRSNIVDFASNFIPFAHWPAYNMPYWAWTFMEKPHIPATLAKVRTAHALQTKDLPERLRYSVPIPGSERFTRSLGLPEGTRLRVDPYRALSFMQSMPGGTPWQAQRLREVMDDPASPGAVMTIGQQMGIRPWPWFEYVLGYKGLMGDDWYPYDLSSFEPLARALFDTNTTPSSWLREQLGLEPDKFLDWQTEKEVRGQIMRGEAEDWEKAASDARKKAAIYVLVGMTTGFYPKEFTAEEEERIGMTEGLRQAVAQDVRDTGGDPSLMEIGEQWNWAKRHGKTMTDAESNVNRFYEQNPEYRDIQRTWMTEEERNVDEQTSSYFDESNALREARDDALATLPVPHPDEEESAIWDEYGEAVEALREKYPLARLTPSSMRPIEVLYDRSANDFMRQLKDTKPFYDKEEYDSYYDYKQDLAEWERTLWERAAEMFGYEDFMRFRHFATPQALEEYTKARHTPTGAADYVWKKHIQSPAFEAGKKAQVVQLAGIADWDNVTERIAQWQEYIDVAAEVNEIDPRILGAIVDVESGGDPEAYDKRSQATGLMQVVPGEVFEGRPTQAQLEDPKTNIDTGAAILQGYLEDADWDLKQALYQYSGGSEWSSFESFEKNYWDRLLQKFKGLWGESLGELQAEASDKVTARTEEVDVETLIPLIMAEYPGRWTEAELREELEGKDIRSVQEAYELEKPEDAAEAKDRDEAWDLRASLPPGVYRDAIDALPEVSAFMSTGESPRAAIEAIGTYVDEHPVVGNAQEWAQAEREHDEFRRYVYNNFGTSIYEEQNAYYTAKDAGKYPEPSERLQAYWEAHSQFRLEHPAYTKYYFPDWEPYEGGGKGGGRAGGYARQPTQEQQREEQAKTWEEFAAGFEDKGLLELIQSYLLMSSSQRGWFLAANPNLAKWLREQDPDWLGELAASLGAAEPRQRGQRWWRPPSLRWYQQWR